MRHTMLRYRVLAGFVISSGLAFGLFLATVPAKDSPGAASADDWRGVAMALAINGRFDSSLAQFRKAAKLNTDDESLAASVKLLSDYMAVRADMDRGRIEEYDRAVSRVQRCLLASDSADMLAKDDLGKKLRDKLDEAITAYEGGGAVSDLADVSTEKAAELRNSTMKDVAELNKAVKGIGQLLKGDDSEFAAAFRTMIDSFGKKCDAYEKAWRSAKLDSKSDRSTAIRALWPLQYDQAVALGDIEAMTGDKPWRTAITQIRLAKQLSSEKEKKDIVNKSWYGKVVALVTRKGAKALEKEDWHEALSAFWSLSELDRGDEKLRKQVKIIRRHVRVLNMYGDKDKDKGEHGLKRAFIN